MFRGLLGTKREWLMGEMIDNFIYLFNKFHIIPNFSAPASLGRSQPPFLSSMIIDTYKKQLNPTNPYKSIKGIERKWYEYSKKGWLRETIAIAKQEYELVWIDEKNGYNHQVPERFLSRYGDRDIGYAHSSELESGWDMTSRFYNRCDQFAPIDLNSYLYKYEIDFAYVAQLLGERGEEQEWKEKATKRQAEINKYMWNDEEGFFFDYNYVYDKKSHFYSLASFAPLWTGFASMYQAKRMVTKLHKFETQFGLTITSKDSLAKPIDLSKIQKEYHPAINQITKPKQWDYPNIWPPIEYLTVIGLLRYGFKDEARRIMSNSVKGHAVAFRKFHTFFEKMNGETGEMGRGAEYEDQLGFGWTNAIFYRYIQILDAMDSNQQIYEESEEKEPPYTLRILH
jgi:alpha,alpha-trehalase